MSDRSRKSPTLPPDVAAAAATIRNATADAPIAPPDPVVQSAINRMAESSDSINRRQMDTSNTSNALGAIDEAESSDAAKFAAVYAKATQHGLEYLSKRAVSGNRTAMIPPHCEIHPKLGAWGLNFCGKWMLIRWLSKNHNVRQKRHRQGWQYFEGREWATRLGLNPEFYVNDKGRIELGDLELGWHTEDYHFRMMRRVVDDRADAITTAKERLMGIADSAVPRVELIEGSDVDVMAELRSRQRSAAM
jgi:hypothetical protein